jgi:hypothetical protein
MPKPTTNHQIQRYERQPHKILGIQEPRQRFWPRPRWLGNNSILNLVVHQWPIVYDVGVIESSKKVVVGIVKRAD